MKIKAVHQYKQDVDSVFALFHDVDFMQKKYEGLGARNVKILECAGSAGKYTVKVQREVPADVPGLLKKFLNPWNTLVQSEQWQGESGGPYTCNLAIDISGVPVSITGRMELCSAGTGCVNEVQLEVKCSIPLVGGKLADFVGSDAEKSMQAEYQFLTSSLS